MGAEQEGERSQKSMVEASPHMATGINTDGGHNEATNQVALR